MQDDLCTSNNVFSDVIFVLIFFPTTCQWQVFNTHQVEKLQKVEFVKKFKQKIYIGGGGIAWWGGLYCHYMTGGF